MIIPDVNLILYATISAFPQHAAARAWWERTLSQPDTVGIAPVVAAGFLRLSTNPRLLEVPLSVTAALDYVEEWLARPMVTCLTSDARHLQESLRLIRLAGTAGNLTTDAQIAAHARLERATVASNDTDFGRFPDIRTVNPLRGSDN